MASLQGVCRNITNFPNKWVCGKWLALHKSLVRSLLCICSRNVATPVVECDLCKKWLLVLEGGETLGVIQDDAGRRTERSLVEFQQGPVEGAEGRLGPRNRCLRLTYKAVQAIHSPTYSTYCVRGIEEIDFAVGTLFRTGKVGRAATEEVAHPGLHGLQDALVKDQVGRVGAVETVVIIVVVTFVVGGLPLIAVEVGHVHPVGHQDLPAQLQGDVAPALKDPELARGVGEQLCARRKDMVTTR